jgi:imidazolonepropionase-like amidohydrolase
MILSNARLFDGTGEVWDRANIKLEGKRIVSISAGELPPQMPGERVLDLTGKTIIPGLINCHTHICLDGSGDPEAAWNRRTFTQNALLAALHARRALLAGITTMRDLGGIEYVDVGLRDAINEGLALGPRMLVSGKMICITGGHGWGMGRQADGPAEVRKAAREQLKAGADVIKVMATGGVMTPGVDPGAQQLREDEMRAAAEEAAKAGKLTATHAQGAAGIKAALRAGIGSIEHGIFLDDEAIDLMLEHGAFYVPTLAAGYCILRAGPEFGVPDYVLEKTKRVADTHVAAFERARQAGVLIAAGNDGGTPLNTADNLPCELERMVAYGFTPAQALLSATQVAARLLRMDDQLGSVEAGKLADLVILNADPLTDIQNVRKISQVIKDGRLVAGQVGADPSTLGSSITFCEREEQGG